MFMDKKKIKVYKCPDCGLYFQKKSKLCLHQKDFHNFVFDKIPCYYPYCNKSYISEEKLNYHIQKFHMNLIKIIIIQIIYLVITQITFLMILMRKIILKLNQKILQIKKRNIINVLTKNVLKYIHHTIIYLCI